MMSCERSSRCAQPVSRLRASVYSSHPAQRATPSAWPCGRSASAPSAPMPSRSMSGSRSRQPTCSCSSAGATCTRTPSQASWSSSIGSRRSAASTARLHHRNWPAAAAAQACGIRLLGTDYLGPVVGFRRSTIVAVGGFRPDADGCQPLALALGSDTIGVEFALLPAQLATETLAVEDFLARAQRLIRIVEAVLSERGVLAEVTGVEPFVRRVPIRGRTVNPRVDHHPHPRELRANRRIGTGPRGRGDPRDHRALHVRNRRVRRRRRRRDAVVRRGGARARRRATGCGSSRGIEPFNFSAKMNRGRSRPRGEYPSCSSTTTSSW